MPHPCNLRFYEFKKCTVFWKFLNQTSASLLFCGSILTLDENNVDMTETS